jgi:hypothetical protein
MRSFAGLNSTKLFIWEILQSNMTIKEILARLQIDVSIALLKITEIATLIQGNNEIKFMSGSTLSAIHNQLIVALLECDSIQRNLQSIKADLPTSISSRVSDSDSDLIQVRDLVRICVRHGELDLFIDVVGQYEGNSLALEEVLRVAGEIKKPRDSTTAMGL